MLQPCLCIRYYLKLQTLRIAWIYHSCQKNNNKNGDNDSSRNNDIILMPNSFVSIKAVTMINSVFLDLTLCNLVKFILNPLAQWKLQILCNINYCLPNYSVTYHKTVSFVFELRHSTYSEVNSWEEILAVNARVQSHFPPTTPSLLQERHHRMNQGSPESLQHCLCMT